MRPRKFLAAFVLASLGLTGALLEASFVHSDDGCTIETHCKACLLRLGTTGVVPVTFALPEVEFVVDEVSPAPTPSREEAAPKSVPSRGPPLA